jgi:hypothetical protein
MKKESLKEVGSKKRTSIKNAHGCFNIAHVNSYVNADEFIEAMKHALNHLDKKTKSEVLKKVYSECQNEIKTTEK